MTTYFSAFPRNQESPVITESTVMTMGTFDGIHLGHRKVLSTVASRAKTVGKKSALVTFRPHPLTILSPKRAPLLLTTHQEKMDVLDRCGIDYVAFLPFDDKMANCDPADFVRDVLVAEFGLSELVVGYDHRFGKGRLGDANLLQSLGNELEFSLRVMSPIQKDARPISSSRIRKALLSGDVKLARDDLGRAYSLLGEVIKGKGRGRNLGFPTANIRAYDVHNEKKLIPCEGVYAVVVEVDSISYMGALHIGPKPTFDEMDKVVELHLLDFDRNIYGKQIKIEFIEYVRAVSSFESVQDLIVQMDRDVEKIRKILGGSISK